MNTSVIVSPVTSYKPISSEDLRRCAPSIFAEHARPGVSSRYTFVSTAQVVALLRDEGWEPVKACEQRVRMPERMDFRCTRFGSSVAPIWMQERFTWEAPGRR